LGPKRESIFFTPAMEHTMLTGDRIHGRHRQQMLKLAEPSGSFEGDFSALPYDKVRL
jgi:hypothetical protein